MRTSKAAAEAPAPRPTEPIRAQDTDLGLHQPVGAFRAQRIGRFASTSLLMGYGQNPVKILPDSTNQGTGDARSALPNSPWGPPRATGALPAGMGQEVSGVGQRPEAGFLGEPTKAPSRRLAKRTENHRYAESDWRPAWDGRRRVRVAERCSQAK